MYYTDALLARNINNEQCIYYIDTEILTISSVRIYYTNVVLERNIDEEKIICIMIDQLVYQ